MHLSTLYGEILYSRLGQDEVMHETILLNSQ
jgi:hypothetical protein